MHLRPQQVQLRQEVLLKGCAAKRRSLLGARALAARHRLCCLQHAKHSDSVVINSTSRRCHFDECQSMLQEVVSQSLKRA